MAKQSEEENPLVNIIVNVLLPVIILGAMSKEEGKLWHVGPYIALTVSLLIPLGYGFWHFFKHKSLNLFSAVGAGAILLTGIISIYLWSGSPQVKAQAAWIFGAKEAIQPLILGSLFLLTHRSKTPLFRSFIYSDSIFDVKAIERSISEKSNTTAYQKLIWHSTLLFFGSFLISAILNMGLSYWFLADLDPKSPTWKEEYNADLARITGWGWVVIGLPLMVIGGFILFRMVKGLKELTGFDTEKILLPR